MDSSKRRLLIMDVLKEAKGAITGSELSKHCNVSRQIIVGDVAIMRAQGINIISTPRGYQLITKQKGGLQQVFVCCHGPELVEQELEAIVDNGGIVYNVVVEHEVYGDLEGKLNLHSRRDVQQYLKRMKDSKAELLSRISGGIHTHLVETANAEDMAAVKEALENLSVLYK